MELIAHAIADLLPMMDGEAFEQFKADIAKHGQREPITLFEGRIIDGRNRYRACRELKIEPITRDWDESGSLVDYITSMNYHRRHMTSSQRAAYAVEMLPFAEAEAKERQKMSQGRGAKGTAKLPYLNDRAGAAREHVAKAMNTSARYVSDAKVLKRESPELFEKVKSGELSMHKAVSERRASSPEPKPTKPAKVQVSRVDEVWAIIQELYSLTKSPELTAPYSKIKGKVSELKERFYSRFVRSKDGD